MPEQLDEEIALTLKRRPWMMAEEWSIWRASGTYKPDNRGTFIDCLMVTLPHYMTGGSVLFRMIGTLDDIVTPDEIERATEYELVPRTPDSGEGDR